MSDTPLKEGDRVRLVSIVKPGMVDDSQIAGFNKDIDDCGLHVDAVQGSTGTVVFVYPDHFIEVQMDGMGHTIEHPAACFVKIE